MSELTRVLRSGIQQAATVVSERVWDRLHAAYGLSDERAKVELYGHLLGMLAGFLDGILPDENEPPTGSPPDRRTPVGAGG